MKVFEFISAILPKRKTDDLSKQEADVLQSPFIDDFPQNTLNIRRNLIIISFITLFYKLANLEITSANFFGIKIESLSTIKLDIGLLLILLYLLIHFILNSIYNFKEFRLRATGAKKSLRSIAAASGGFGGGGVPSDQVAVEDIRQSDLMSWFDQQRHYIWSAVASAENLHEICKENFEKVKNNEELFRNANEVKSITKAIYEINNHLKNINSINFLSISLNQYSIGFFGFLNQQHKRWLIIEWIFPILLGSTAITILYGSIFYSFNAYIDWFHLYLKYR